MAITGNTLSRFDLTSTREDLSDRIDNVDPVDTIVMTHIGREKSSNTVKEWNVDTLSAATDKRSGRRCDLRSESADVGREAGEHASDQSS